MHVKRDGDMSLCSSEGLTCYKCNRFKVGVGCRSAPQTTCIAEPGQKCKIIKTFLEGRMKNIVTLGCTEPGEECDVTVHHPNNSPTDTICCNTNLCNVP
ncbi:lymphocyte antigen 6 complex locus protein G6c-like [Crotalus adamanteus]|uniref:Lymphocyte antigen 6 complex locus protein G6c-like n=1 Tax=Crotalus adamanteus TaxID=8729 RepID=A0AAW1AZC8_CROAD